MWMEAVRIELASDRLQQQQQQQQQQRQQETGGEEMKLFSSPVRDGQAAEFSVTVWDGVSQRRSRHHAAPGQVGTPQRYVL